MGAPRQAADLHGLEFAQESEWAEGRELDWWLCDNADHAGVQRLVKDLNRVYRETPALFALDSEPAGFQWIDANDSHGNVLSFVRTDGQGSQIACVVNFANLPHHDYRIGLPQAGPWSEVLNTDAAVYAGSGVGNLGASRPRSPLARPAGVRHAVGPPARRGVAALRRLSGPLGPPGVPFGG